MSYIIPPRLKPQDYRKGAITQDEYLRIAIANDANISAARKAVKMGEVVQLPPSQTATPAELLADISKQESDARTNLLRLGFRDQEVATIISNLLNEPDVLRALNINFPAIEGDVKRRFNTRLLTPNFFLEYLREYNETLNASRGLDVNSSSAVRRPLNALINSIAELKQIIPDPSILGYIRQQAENQRAVGQDTLDRLERIEDWTRYANTLGGLPPTQQFQDIQRVLDALQDLPDRGAINRLYQELLDGANVNTTRIINRINEIASSAPRFDAPSSAPRSAPIEAEAVESMEEAIARRDTSRAVGRPPPVDRPQVAVNWLGDRVNTITDFDALRIGDKKAFLSQVGISPYLKNADGVKMYLTNLTNTNINTTNASDLVNAWLKLKGRIGDVKLNESGLEGEYRVLIGQGLRPFGKSKLKIEDMGGVKLKKIKLGKGLSVKETPTYREFGKYAIHIPQLEQQDLLNVKYKSLGGIPKFKPMPVSDVFRDFLIDLLEGGKVNQRVYLQIEPKERKVFEEMAIGAGVWNGLGLKRTTTSNDEEDRKRFELLKGEYIAGNNSPKVLQELRRIVVKFINEGKIRKVEGMNLLMEISI